MAKAKAKPKATTKPKAKPSPAAIKKVEARARQLLDEDDAGMIDNVWDIVDDLQDIDDKLPKTSPVYKEWKKFYDSCIDIMVAVG